MGRHLMWVLLFLILFAGLGVRLFHIDAREYSLSEMDFVHNSLNHPNCLFLSHGKELFFPMPHIFTGFWAMLQGYSEASIRGLMTLFNILSALLIFKLAQKLFKSKLAGFYSFLLANFSAVMVEYSRHGRPYSMLLFFFMLSYYLFYECFFSGRRKLLFLLFISQILLIQSHPLAIIFIGAQFITLLLLKKPVKGFLYSSVLAALLNAYHFWMLFQRMFLENFEALHENLNWIPPASVSTLQEFSPRLLIGFNTGWSWLFVVSLLLGIWAMARMKRKNLTLLLTPFGVFLVFIVGFNLFTGLSLFNFDYFFPLVSLGFVTVGLGLWKLKFLGPLVLGVMLLGNIMAYDYSENTAFSQGVSFILEHAITNDTIIIPYPPYYFLKVFYDESLKELSISQRIALVDGRTDYKYNYEGLVLNHSESWFIFVNVPTKPSVHHNSSALLTPGMSRSRSIERLKKGEVELIHLFSE